MPPRISIQHTSAGELEEDALDDAVQEHADDGSRQKRQQNAQDELSRLRIMREREEHLPQFAGIDGQDRQNGAELDQHLEDLLGRFEPEKMSGEQQMSGRGDWNKLGQSFQKAEQDHLPRRHANAPCAARNGKR